MSGRRAPEAPRACPHPVAQHQHGTAVAAKRDGCRCGPCVQALIDQDRRRRLDRLLGVPRRVDSAPVREHITALNRDGLGFVRIAELADVSPSTVMKIARRDPNRSDGQPQRRVTPEIAERILAVRASLDVVSDGCLIDGTGTLRRLQALHARGWSRRLLAERLDIEHGTLNHLAARGRVTGAIARAVRDLYEQLWDQEPPAGTPGERAAVTTTLQWAREQRFAPPAAWDDAALDDPSAVPDVGGRARVTPLERLDELRWLLRSGTPREEALRRAGYADWGNARQSAIRAGYDLDGLLELMEAA